MKLFVTAMLVFGAMLLGFVLAQTDLAEVGRYLAGIGALGAFAIVVVHALGYVSLAVSWGLVIRGVKLRIPTLASLWKILMVGTALDTVTPFGGLGGEPVKAALLKRDLGTPYTDGAASLVLTRITDLIAQLLFIAIGFALALRADHFDATLRAGAAAGLCLFVAALVGFLAVQHVRGFERLQTWLQDGRFAAKRSAPRLAAALAPVVEVEQQLVDFYRREHGRFAGSVLGAFGDWVSGAVAVWIAMGLLGHPVSVGDALVIEAFVIGVRSIFFFVPADLGTQEAAHLVIVTAVTGSGELAVALAAVRRAKDLLWVAWGLAIGWKAQLVGRAVQLETGAGSS